MLIQEREQARQVFFDVWQKLQNKSPLQPMESVIADIIQWHPDYHNYLSDTQKTTHEDFQLEQGNTNPFLHMGMHIAIREQLGMDRPAGIRAIHHTLAVRYQSEHEAEHQMIECLGASLWEAQRNQRLPDEVVYFECLNKLC